MIFILSLYTPLYLKEDYFWYRKQNYCNFISYKKEIVIPLLWKELEMEYEFLYLKPNKKKDKNKEFTCSFLDS